MSNTQNTIVPLTDIRWEPNNQLEAMVTFLAALTAGLPDADSGIIQEGGVGNNFAERYENECFAIRDYCWCEGSFHPNTAEEEPTCPPNFEHYASGTKGIWYKYLGRDVEFNRSVDKQELLDIFLDCLRSLPTDNIHTINGVPVTDHTLQIAADDAKTEFNLSGLYELVERKNS